MRLITAGSMKLLLSLLGVSMAIVAAVPAHAHPIADDNVSGDDGAFLSDVRQVGISYSDPGQAISAGKAVCGFLDRGVSGLQLLNDLRTQNPALSMNGAAQFATVSAKSYCPHQLQEAEKDVADAGGGSG